MQWLMFLASIQTCLFHDREIMLTASLTHSLPEAELVLKADGFHALSDSTLPPIRLVKPHGMCWMLENNHLCLC